MIAARINEISCIVFYDERLGPESAPKGFPHVYNLRHDENDWTRPISLEPSVVVNFFGTVFTREQVAFDESGYVEVLSFVMKREYVRFSIPHEVFLRGLGL